MTQNADKSAAAGTFHPRPESSASGPKTLLVSHQVAQYMAEHCGPRPEALDELVEETARVAGPRALMQVAPEQGALLTLLARSIGARRALEIGTFTGYSAICIAYGLSDGGTLDTVDVSSEFTPLAQRFAERAGVGERIRFHCASAAEFLGRQAEGEPFDLVFFDGDKPNYLRNYETVFPLLRDGGLLLVDNVLWGGRVVVPQEADEWTEAIRGFNDAVARDERVDCVMVSVADGLTLVRKRTPAELAGPAARKAARGTPC